MCVCGSLDRQNPHLEFKTLQYHNMWTSYDTLEKTIIQRFVGKASVKRKGLQRFHPSHRAVSAHGLMRRTIRGKPYNYVQLREFVFHACLLLKLKSVGLRIKYLKVDQPSELRHDFQRCLLCIGFNSTFSCFY